MERLERTANTLKEASQRFGLKINENKTHLMSTNKDRTISLGANHVDKVEKFKYLGAVVTLDANSSHDVRARTAIARTTCTSLIPLWRTSDLSLRLKKRLVQSLVWSVASYGRKSWTLKKTDCKRLEAFELWVWRRVLRISWTEHRTNLWVRNKVGVSENKGLLAAIKRRKLAKYGHWKRRPKSLVLATIEGEIQGKNKQGRRKTGWIDNIREWSGGMEQANETARRRQRP